MGKVGRFPPPVQALSSRGGGSLVSLSGDATGLSPRAAAPYTTLAGAPPSPASHLVLLAVISGAVLSAPSPVHLKVWEGGLGRPTTSRRPLPCAALFGWGRVIGKLDKVALCLL